MNPGRKTIIILILAPVLLFLIGITGYMLLEGWNAMEAFYMTAITLTTVGFGEVRPLSDSGRLFTVFLILLGAGSLAYGFSTGIEYLVTVNVTGQFRKRRMMKTIEKLKDHVIVCGYGRVGISAIESLASSQREIVVIERDPQKLEALLDTDLLVVEGDATKDEVLLQAGIDRAWGLIVCTGDDSLNLFIVLSARAISSDLFIVTRSVNAENESKMRRAGANRVVSPYQIGGKHMANIMIRPHVTDFFDVVTLDGGMELWVEELVINPGSTLVGKTVGKADIRRRTGVTLVALLRRDDKAALMPDAETTLAAGDELIVLGTREQLARLESLTEGQKQK